MKKKVYIKPQMKSLSIFSKWHLMQKSGIEASAESKYGASEAFSRETIWDEEQEENTGGWFQ